MLDFIIYICIATLIFFGWYSITKRVAIGYVLGAAFAVIITIGLFTSGWQTYSVPTYTLIESGNTTTINQAPLTISANLYGTPEQMTIFLLASFSAIVSLVFVFGGIAERRKNVAVESASVGY